MLHYYGILTTTTKTLIAILTHLQMVTTSALSSLLEVTIQRRNNPCIVEIDENVIISLQYLLETKV